MFAKTTTTALLCASLIGSALAHMDLLDPTPLRYKTNPNAGSNVDYNYNAPLAADGSNFPCKGYLSDLGTPSAKSVNSYPAGSQQSFALDGQAPHGGGSMQVSLSYDQGKTFKVLKSFIGNAPRNAGGNAADGNQVYTYDIPADAAPGEVIFSWSWFNEIGNREMYQNCAVVTIEGTGTNKLEDKPDMFVANIGNGCGTTESFDVEFPNPGSDVDKQTPPSGAGTAPPTGTCQAAAPNPDPVPAPEPSSPSDSEPAPEPTPTSTEDVPEPSSTIAPPSDPGCAQHVVQLGQTCDMIAEIHQTTSAIIMSLNPDINAGCTNLQPGQILTLRKRSRIMRNYP